jgi:hypothetical protein
VQNDEQIRSILDSGAGLDDGYRHIVKKVRSHSPLLTEGALFKWYEVHAPDREVPDSISAMARTYLESTPLEARGFGFVILHRCGEDFYFLIVSTWKNSNEVWETVFYKDGDAMSDFALFPRDAQHKPVFCVWELVPVWHEQQAWVRFLTSSRDEGAATLWRDDLYSGNA